MILKLAVAQVKLFASDASEAKWATHTLKRQSVLLFYSFDSILFNPENLAKWKKGTFYQLDSVALLE